LPKQFPAFADVIAVLISYVDAAEDFVSIRTERATDAEIAMMILATIDARLVSNAKAPSVVVAPE
jgi:hypothetical protein